MPNLPGINHSRAVSENDAIKFCQTVLQGFVAGNY
jgi:hypothetical protein